NCPVLPTPPARTHPRAPPPPPAPPPRPRPPPARSRRDAAGRRPPPPRAPPPGGRPTSPAPPPPPAARAAPRPPPTRAPRSGRAHGLAVPGQQMQRIGIDAAVVQQADERRRDERRLLGRLGEHRVADDERGGHLTGEDRQWEIPRTDAHDRPERNGARARSELA